MGWKRKMGVAAGVGAVVAVSVGVGVIAGRDFGVQVQDDLAHHSNQLFGFVKPVEASSTVSADPARATADPTLLVTAAKGLTVRSVAQVAGAPNLDQMALWPNDTAPTHVIGCNEQGAGQFGVVAINLADGSSFPIIRSGLTSCDPVRRTAWGTILAGEENGTAGRLFEIVDPLNTHDVTVNPDSSTTSPNVVNRTPVLGSLSYEGLALYDSGLLYYADENRPASGAPGGAYYKFIPSVPWNGSFHAATAADLAHSPLAAGKVYGLRVGTRGGTDYGQGTETGLGAWIGLCDGTTTCGNLRAAAVANHLTGYYRPEDAEKDRTALAAGQVKWCINNTGNEASQNSGHTWGNTMCVSDGSFAEALANTAKPDAQLFMVGTSELAMPDNIAQQPGTGNWVMHEDGDIADTHQNNDVWICLPDGADVDDLTDGCVRMATLNDLIANGGEGAEWTGGFWDASGSTFYVSVQHNMTGDGTLLAITGF
jgi:secreted PhoX family phosphatase